MLEVLLDEMRQRDPGTESNQVPYRDAFWVGVAQKINEHFKTQVVPQESVLGLRKLWYEKKGWYQSILKKLNLTGQAGMSVVLQAIADEEEKTE